MKTVAVIGGGFSGTMVAVNIVKLSGGKIKVYLIEKSGDFARGVAYGTRNEQHLLNAQSKILGAFADNPGHFAEWIGDIEGNIYYPRKIYGDYLSEILQKLGDNIIKLPVEAIDININDKSIVTLSDDKIIEVNAVVLALGNLPPSITDNSRFGKLQNHIFSNPWGETGELKKIKSNANILIIGSGLTMVDMAITLSAGNSARKIIAVSRHGLLPQPHAGEKTELKFGLPEGDSILTKLKFLRAKIKEYQQENIAWQSVIDALRPLTIKLWQSAPVVEKKRFLRHLRSYWDTCRHRMSQVIVAKIAALQETGQLVVKAGRVMGIEANGNQFEVMIKLRGAESADVYKFDYILNCTSPEVNYESNYLMKNLFTRGIVQSGTLNMGIKTDNNGAVIGKNGEISKTIFALGPICKGQLWETVAVPELRVQAQNVAETLVGNL